jgi:uncharacterized SAM-binding protein YcdF (DUF218 family)
MDLSTPYRWLLTVADPGNLFALFALAYIWLNLRKRVTAASVLAALVVAVLLLVPVGAWTLQPLIERFARAAAPSRLDGILVLGGGSENPERLIAAVGLSRRFPHATVVFSDIHDSVEARDTLLRLGVAPSQIRLENHAADTWQNLSLSWCLVRPSPDQTWFLVTSDYHMPRAMGVAQKIGWNLAPWPSGPSQFRPVFSLQFADNLKTLATASHEWFGLVAYYLEGRSSSIFPRGSAGVPTPGKLRCRDGTADSVS